MKQLIEEESQQRCRVPEDSLSFIGTVVALLTLILVQLASQSPL